MNNKYLEEYESYLDDDSPEPAEPSKKIEIFTTSEKIKGSLGVVSIFIASFTGITLFYLGIVPIAMALLGIKCPFCYFFKKCKI